MKGRILIVDDDAPTREILERYLSMHGYECDVAENVEEAIRVMPEGDFHVVVTDKNMPSNGVNPENGLVLIRHVREHYPETGVIVITGFATIESAVEAMRLGAFDYIAKPFELEMLKDKVDRIREYQTFLNPAAIMNSYQFLHEQLLELYERGDRTSDEKKQHFLALIQETMDVIFDRFKGVERLLLYQRERLAEIAACAGQLRDIVPDTDPAYSLIVRIAEQSELRL